MHTKPEPNWDIWSICVGAVALLLFATLYMGGVFDGAPNAYVATPQAVIAPTE